MNHDLIRQSLERYGEALSAGNLAGIWSCWEVPGLVLADDGAIAVSDQSQVEAFLARALGWYQSRGLMATRPERAVALTERLTLVTVPGRRSTTQASTGTANARTTSCGWARTASTASRPQSPSHCRTPTDRAQHARRATADVLA